MFDLQADNPKLISELSDVVKLFFPSGKDAPKHIAQSCGKEANMRVNIEIDGKIFTFDYINSAPADTLEFTRYYTRANKLSLYKALSSLTGRHLPWGSLTGIRPTKLAYELTSGGKSIKEAVDILQETYLVSAEKASLVEQILNSQTGIYRRDDRLINLYVHIPFCTSRCNYCSFITNVLTPSYRFVQPYIDALTEEITETLRFLKMFGYTVYSVYVGGGTPTAITAEQLRQVLSCIGVKDVEFTCEAGRPDTITDEKLRVMADCGVNRISVNPQSLCDETLKRIGRGHTARDFHVAFEKARKYAFDVNTDLIAGLEGESADEFCKTADGIVALSPENITVHTLARKNGSEIKQREYEHSRETERMVGYAYKTITAAGYVPYYLYRQKQMSGNLENTGYCKPGKQCVNNVTTMEEVLGVAACGAGAISKRVFCAENRIERLANLRDVQLYLQQFDARLVRKRQFFQTDLKIKP